MKHTCHVSRQIVIGNKRIPIVKGMVNNVIGFVEGTKKVQLSSTNQSINTLVSTIKRNYMDGESCNLTKCHDLCLSDDDKDSFLRKFYLLAVSSIFAPGKDNSCCMEYLYSLHDVNKVQEFDWAGHILNAIFSEVKRYHEIINSDIGATTACNYFGGFLQLLAVSNYILPVLIKISLFQSKLIVDPANFSAEHCIAELRRVEKDFSFSNAHLLFFPLIMDYGWVLVCINKLQKTLHFFDSNDSFPVEDIIPLLEKLATNFSAACLEVQIINSRIQFDPDLSNEYPKHKNNKDSGIFNICYTELFEGKSMKLFNMDYIRGKRKLVAFDLVHSKLNLAASTAMFKKKIRK